MFVKTRSSEQEWLEISKKFETRWNYPHALGAMDGKHVTIRRPGNAGSFIITTGIRIQYYFWQLPVQSTNVYMPILDLTTELMTQVYGIKAHYYKRYKMVR